MRCDVKSKKEWDANLPDTSQWLPRDAATETFAEAFYKRCQHIERTILLRSQYERSMAIDAFDSGTGLEDIIREELSNVCPHRYSVKAGTIDDRNGRTAGDFEVAIINDIWFPTIKAGATSASRKVHFPIESVYAVLEVKQTLNYNTLDAAMEKLVKCHRLYRPSTEAGRIVENRKLNDCPHKTTNPLFSAIIAPNIEPGISIESLIDRFFAISKTLKRKELVRAICVLGQGTVSWGFRESPTSIKPALFMSDLDVPIVPVYYRAAEGRCAFYQLAVILLTHLYNTILGAEDIHAHYGSKDLSISSPADPAIRLDPDLE